LRTRSVPAALLVEVPPLELGAALLRAGLAAAFLAVLGFCGRDGAAPSQGGGAHWRAHAVHCQLLRLTSFLTAALAAALGVAAGLVAAQGRGAAGGDGLELQGGRRGGHIACWCASSPFFADAFAFFGSIGSSSLLLTSSSLTTLGLAGREEGGAADLLRAPMGTSSSLLSDMLAEVHAIADCSQFLNGAEGA
jgi:hypothetical protein